MEDRGSRSAVLYSSFIIRPLPSHSLRGYEVLVRLTAADDFPGGAIDEHFRGAGAVVGVAAHGEAVGGGGEDGQEVAAGGVRQRAVLGQVVAALANRADDIHRLAVRGGAFRVAGGGHVLRRRLDGPDEVVRIVERRADEVVHP